MTGRRSEVLSLQTESNCHSWESLPPLRRQNQKTCQEPDWVVAASGTAVSAGSSPLCLPACMHACCKHVHSHYFCNPSEYLKRRPHAHGGKLRWAAELINHFVLSLLWRGGGEGGVVVVGWGGWGGGRSHWPSSSAPPCWGRLKSWWRTRTGATPQTSTSCTGRTACSLACTSSAAWRWWQSQCRPSVARRGWKQKQQQQQNSDSKRQNELVLCTFCAAQRATGRIWETFVRSTGSRRFKTKAASRRVVSLRSADAESRGALIQHLICHSLCFRTLGVLSHLVCLK